MKLSANPSFVHSRKIRTLADYWHAKRPGTDWPKRGDIAPSDVPELLPNMVICEVTRDTMQVFYRLVGTRVVEMSRFDFTGRWLHEMTLASVEPGIWAAAYQTIVDSREPVYGRSGIPISQGSEIMLEEEFGIFPLDIGNSDRFQCIALEDYGDAQHIDPDVLQAMKPR